MHPEDAPGVLAVGAGLLAEAGADAGVVQRQLLRVHPLAHVQRADGLLGRSDEVLVFTISRHL